MDTLPEVMAEAGHAPGEADTMGESKYKQIMGIKAVHYLACWALIYVGVEVTLGGKDVSESTLRRHWHLITLCVGWIVTFIEQRRGGGASAGYISSGFFGGLMLGRVTLLWLNRKVTEVFHNSRCTLKRSADRRATCHVHICLPCHSVSSFHTVFNASHHVNISCHTG